MVVVLRGGNAERLLLLFPVWWLLRTPDADGARGCTLFALTAMSFALRLLIFPLNKREAQGASRSASNVGQQQQQGKIN